ncbi:MAG TPA: hypothetical protein VMH27_03220 [Puia sp.]|nr:hypothetical protein [Puia sp.]
MKKIVLPVESGQYPADCLEIAAQLNSVSKLLLTTTIVPDSDYASRWAVPHGFAPASYLAEVSSVEIEAISNTTARIKEFCTGRNIENIVRKDQFNFALQEIRKESRFADLLLVSGRHFFENISADQPNAYMKEMLQHAESPVLLVPGKPFLPEQLILAYDGSPSSVFAMRQFVYVFPELCDRAVSVVHLNEKRDEPVPDAEFLIEWLERHVGGLEVLNLPIGRSEFLNTWMQGRKAPWLIAGSFGRSSWSEAFSRSFITDSIRKPAYPVFQAHV